MGTLWRATSARYSTSLRLVKNPGFFSLTARTPSPLHRGIPPWGPKTWLISHWYSASNTPKPVLIKKHHRFFFGSVKIFHTTAAQRGGPYHYPPSPPRGLQAYTYLYLPLWKGKGLIRPWGAPPWHTNQPRNGAAANGAHGKL